MVRKTLRKSRRVRYCETCRQQIAVGDTYQEMVASPNHGEVGNTGWWRMDVCLDHKYD